MSNKCSATVYDRDGFGNYACNIPAKYTHDGKKYCHVHYPPNVEARRAKRSAEFDARWQAKTETWNRDEERRTHRATCESACAGVSFIGDPTGAVKALVEAVQLSLDVTGHHSVSCKTARTQNADDCTCWVKPMRSALARVRMDGKAERSHERSHRAILRESGIIVDDGDTKKGEK